MSQQDTVSGQLNYPCPETDHNQMWLLPKNDFSPKDGVSTENIGIQTKEKNMIWHISC